jgi:acetyl-CoA C-acetyltransferase
VSDIYVIAAKRTAIGKFGGAFANSNPVELATAVNRELVGALPEAGLVDEVIFGNVLSAGCGMNVARQAALGCGLAPSVPAFSVNMVCGSGLKAIDLAAQSIRAGQADVVLAGGTENMSQAPYLLPKARNGYRLGDGEILDIILRDGLTDAFLGRHMGLLGEQLAAEFEISRSDQDAFSLVSQQRWAQAQRCGVFDDEIVPVRLKTRKGEQVVDTDEHPRPDMTAETLASLRPAFKPDGTVTAGNASGINDGAAAVLLASARGAEKAGLKPIARLVACATAALEPARMGLGPVLATRKVLERTGRQIESIDLVELNEAFASQSLACMRQLGLDAEKVNVHGGAIAMGHPIGASGARIVVTLLNALVRRNKQVGLATLCIGGGMGMAALFERC